MTPMRKEGRGQRLLIWKLASAPAREGVPPRRSSPSEMQQTGMTLDMVGIGHPKDVADLVQCLTLQCNWGDERCKLIVHKAVRKQ